MNREKSKPPTIPQAMIPQLIKEGVLKKKDVPKPVEKGNVVLRRMKHEICDDRPTKRKVLEYFEQLIASKTKEEDSEDETEDKV